MRKIMKRGLALLLSSVLLIGTVPVAVMAAESDESLLADFTFDDQTGGFAGGQAKATVAGQIQEVDGRKALYLNGSNFLNVTKEDGSSLLTGVEELTISYDAKPDRADTNWAFYAAPNTRAQSAPEYYIGAFFNSGNIKLERYHNGRTLAIETQVGSQWSHVDIVFEKNVTTLYINDTKINSVTNSNAQLTDILGNNSIFQIGKANWANGEFYKGWLDNFKVYNRALSEEELVDPNRAAEILASDKESLIIEQEVDADFTLPLKGSNGSDISWKSSDAGVIAISGAKADVKRDANTNKEVTLTATLTMGGQSLTKEFKVTVLKELDAEGILDKALKQLAAPFEEELLGSVTLPETIKVADSELDIQVTWASDKEDVIDTVGTDKAPAGIVTRQEDDTDVTLTVTVSNGTLTKSKDIAVVVKAAAEAPVLTDYIFATFLGDGGAAQQQVCFSTSRDGNHWMDMNNNNPILSVANATEGDRGVRDPFLIRSPEGDKFYLIATDLCIGSGAGTHDWGTAQSKTQSSKYIRIWESYDLVDWGEPWLAEIGVPNSNFTWAPEVIWDVESQQYMVYWAAGGTPSDTDTREAHRTYYSMTRDFRTFTEPKFYCENMIDPYKNQIDSSILHIEGDMYVRTSSSSPDIPIEISKNGLFGDWERISTLEGLGLKYGAGGNTSPGMTIVEGPELFRYNDDDVELDENGDPIPTWGVIVDNYGGRGYFPVATTDFESTIPVGQEGCVWYEPEYDFNSLKRHGTILPITAEEYEAVMEAYSLSAPKNTEAEEKEPIAVYDFESENDLRLYGNAEVVEDEETESYVLYLDGSDNTYASFPNGFFDGRNTMTISMDIKTETADGNFFTFTLGKDTNKYMFLRTRATDFRNAITRGGYSREEEVKKQFTSSVVGEWVNVKLVITEEEMILYINDEFAAKDTIYTTIANLGSNIYGYLGKSLYSDPYFKGYFDNIVIYNRALSENEIKGIEDPEPIPADKSSLQVLFDKAAKIETDKYTEETVKVFIQAYNNAARVLKDEKALQEEVDAAKAQLKAAIDGLVEKTDVVPTPIYEDVAETDWFYDAVMYTYYGGLMTGMDPTHFGPYGQLSRAQFALILYRMEGENAVETDKSFGDIVGDEWYGPAVLWAAENGIVTGYQDGNFGPADMITREQMAVMMYRYAKYLGQDVKADADLSKFADAASVSGFAIEAMKWANANGIITGKENGRKLDPHGNTARSEAAAIIRRFSQ